MVLLPRFDRRRGHHRLLVRSLATFQTAIFMVALLALAYARGGLGAALGGFNTAAGLTLFAALWVVTWWSTRRAVQGLAWAGASQPLSLGELLDRSMRWAGVNGVLFLLALAAVLAVSAAVEQRAPGLLVLPFVVGPIGAPFAFIVGVFFGVLFAVIDWALFALSRRVFLACTRPLPSADA